MTIKRLEHRGIRIVGISDGYDSHTRGRKVFRIVRGLTNELYVDDLGDKTHRGLVGQVERGCHTGGACFGYRSEAVANGNGKRLVVDEAQAAVVRRIFTLFADGHSHRKIAHMLNEEGVPSARGGTWAVSALHGDTTRGSGMLNNELYCGKLIWNRRKWVKDPETGRRLSFNRPESEWMVREMPELRIVSAELWDRVRTRLRSGPPAGTRTGKGAAPRTLLSGILRCSACGGPMVAINSERYGCNQHADRGSAVCPNPLRNH